MYIIVKERSFHFSHFISADLILPEVSGGEWRCVRCETTQFTVAATNQIRQCDLFRSDWSQYL